MLTGTLLLILAVAYIFLKVSNTRAELAKRDAERARREQEAAAALEEAEEEEEIRRSAVDVDAETIDYDDLDAEEFVVEPAAEPEEEEFVVEPTAFPEEEATVIEVPEYETV